MIDHFWPLLQILGRNIFPVICVYDLSIRIATTVDVSGLNLTNLLVIIINDPSSDCNIILCAILENHNLHLHWTHSHDIVVVKLSIIL